MTRDEIIRHFATLASGEHVALAHSLLEAQIAKAEAFGMSRDALLISMLSLSIERGQAEHGPVNMGVWLRDIGIALVERGDTVGRA